MAVARWAAKTLLLYCHPEAVNSEVPGRPRRPWELPAGLLPAMRATGDLPGDLSLWVAVVEPAARPVQLPPLDTILLPRTTTEDGGGGACASTTLGFGLPKIGRGAHAVFQLTFHPLVDIARPLQGPGLVTRLWPQPPVTLDLAAHPILDAAAGKRLTEVFSSGGAVGLPPGQRWPYRPSRA